MQANETLPTLKTAQDLGLNEAEFEKIKEVMGRPPNFTELSIFAVTWSEHCSHKNSILWLKTLPREGKQLLAEAGQENAGLVDIGNGLACAFKIESHNHLAAIEPYQGAATGVGGSHRDVFTMGARPIAALNSLRFGNIDLKDTRHLLQEVVRGIGDYGNCLGVPTVGGEVYFHDCYNQSILVNAMSVGTLKIGETVSAVADGPGNPVLIVGSATGKDGIQGATSAGADLSEDLPAVQVGDPFQEKLLLEATLEAIGTGAIIGIQQVDAGGIACATSAMSAKSGTGMHIDLDKVPTREANMHAFEILLSASQERILIVAKKGQEHQLSGIFEKWDLECARIGEVTDTGRLEFFQHGELVADVPAYPLVLGGGAPVYEREYTKPVYLKKISQFKVSSIPLPANYVETATKIFQSPNLVSKRWIYEQYDSMTGLNSMSTNQPSDAALVRIKDTNRALALTMDCNPAYVYADPYVGAMIAVAEAARNIVCSGGEPLAITNCLNFGNPYNPEVYWQFVHAVKGICEACRKLDVPVTGANVSFYNQSVLKDKTEPVYPTPTIGMMGVIQNVKQIMSLDFKTAGHQIYMIGTPQNDLGSSEYLRVIHAVEYSPAPFFDLDEEFHIQRSLKKLIQDNLIQSAHDISEGGLFTTLMESAIPRELGFDLETDSNFRKDAYLFGEGQSRVVISTTLDNEDELVNYLNTNNVPFTKLGEVTDREIIIDNERFGAIQDWKKVYDHFISEKLELNY